MAVSYDNLWKLLIDKKLKRTDLKDICGISSNVLDVYKRQPLNRSVKQYHVKKSSRFYIREAFCKSGKISLICFFKKM